MLHDILHCIIGGFEHSGTTLVTDLLRQHPLLDSGFEGGLLLKEKPADFAGFEPFYGNVKSTWKMSEAGMAAVCGQAAFPEAYAKLRELSPVIPVKTKKLFDKTPRYMRHMGEILDRHRSLRSIIMIRDLRAVMWSSYKRVLKRQPDMDLDTWMRNVYPITRQHTEKYAAGAVEAARLHPRRVLMVRYEDLCRDPETVAKRVFDHIELSFDRTFLSFTPKYNLTYGKSVEDKYTTEYKGALRDDICASIVRDFSAYGDFFDQSGDG